jgi:hypothetical protein
MYKVQGKSRQARARRVSGWLAWTSDGRRSWLMKKKLTLIFCCCCFVRISHQRSKETNIPTFLQNSVRRVSHTIAKPARVTLSHIVFFLNFLKESTSEKKRSIHRNYDDPRRYESHRRSYPLHGRINGRSFATIVTLTSFPDIED